MYVVSYVLIKYVASRAELVISQSVIIVMERSVHNSTMHESAYFII